MIILLILSICLILLIRIFVVLRSIYNSRQNFCKFDISKSYNIKNSIIDHQPNRSVIILGSGMSYEYDRMMNVNDD